MPWLVGTALVHSLAVTEKRGSFKNWTVLLAIFTFSLSLLGTFLVRSGVLTSVHAFATDPERGVFILGFLVVVIRIWCGLPEGVMYAILLMNALVPFINRATQPRLFGTSAKKKKKEEEAGS